MHARLYIRSDVADTVTPEVCRHGVSFRRVIIIITPASAVTLYADEVTTCLQAVLLIIIAEVGAQR